MCEAISLESLDLEEQHPCSSMGDVFVIFVFVNYHAKQLTEVVVLANLLVLSRLARLLDSIF